MQGNRISELLVFKYFLGEARRPPPSRLRRSAHVQVSTTSEPPLPVDKVLDPPLVKHPQINTITINVGDLSCNDLSRLYSFSQFDITAEQCSVGIHVSFIKASVRICTSFFVIALFITFYYYNHLYEFVQCRL